MNIQMTHHAAARQQQRGIPPLIIEWLVNYGARRQDHHGAEVLYFNKQSRKVLARIVGEEIINRLSALLDTYAVLSDSGTLITVGHRLKRVSH